VVRDVTPHEIADLCGIRSGDLLLSYNGKRLKKQVDLSIATDLRGGRTLVKRVPVTLWRDGDFRVFQVAAGPLGVRLDDLRPTTNVTIAQGATGDLLTTLARGGCWPRLPGTRREVESVAALFPPGRATILLGERATESAVQQLATSGELKKYRYIMFATHGQANLAVAMSSALILTPGSERSAPIGPEAAETDGRVTAQQIVYTWDLDADLVVLSACETALGKYAYGEGYLGFAQALFVKGARSVVLSQWKVDDRATSLLMNRFFRNLLGKRAGLEKPMPKVEALHEAKEWLRNLSQEAISIELAALNRGEVRPLVAESTTTPSQAPNSTRQAGQRPYAHPYYWAAFILIGDPG
jgi:CHAT domain-containing protein